MDKIAAVMMALTKVEKLDFYMAALRAAAKVDESEKVKAEKRVGAMVLRWEL